RGLRRSASISRILWPSSAMAIPRLLTTVDLPSEGPALVTTRTLGRLPPSEENRIDISAERKDSAAIADLRCHVISSTRCSRALAASACPLDFTKPFDQPSLARNHATWRAADSD